MPVKVTKLKKAVEPIKCLWGVACRISSIDQQRNNISLFDVIDQINISKNVFEQLSTQGAAGVQLPHEIVTTLKRVIPAALDTREMRFDYAIELVGSKGSAIQNMIAPMIFPAASERLRLRIEFPVVALDGPGDYFYRISYKLPEDEEFIQLFQIPIQVTIMEKI